MAVFSKIKVILVTKSTLRSDYGYRLQIYGYNQILIDFVLEDILVTIKKYINSKDTPFNILIDHLNHHSYFAERYSPVFSIKQYSSLS